jgi:membrane fusion protein (multidrug efflux system)
MKVAWKSRTAGAALAVTIAACAGTAGCARNAGDAAPAQPAVLVNASDVALVQTRVLESGVTFTGELVPSEIVEVVARFDGDLESVRVREGEFVKKGESLARYQPRDIEDQLQAAESDLASAQAALAAARNAEKRAQRLLDAGGAAPSDLEAAQAQRAAAEAGVEAAEARRNTARENAERLDVPSPITGWISKVYVHGGDRTAVGDKIAQIVDTRELQLEATVPAEALARVQPGTPLRFQVDAFPNETFDGRIERVAPTTEPGTRQVRIYARVENPEGRLAGGLFASGRVVEERKENAKTAPVAALRTEAEKQVVYRVHGGRAERVPVETGIVDEQAGVVELIGNVSPGDSLLTGILPGLRDGAPVRVLSGGSAAEAPAASSPQAAGANPAADAPESAPADTQSGGGGGR